MEINKSTLVNGLCILVILLGHFVVPPPFQAHVLATGYFAFSGAITNWLAIHMLFERVPGLYGSGIIPLKFESFKLAIRNMIMNQFFTVENIENFVKGPQANFNLDPVIDKLDYDIIFDGFMETIQNSKFGGAIKMFGGERALEPMRDPFKRKLNYKLKEVVSQPKFREAFAEHAFHGSGADVLQEKIDGIVNKRLDELTPQMVKQIIQDMIRSHLGWLVVWGGVFGGLIGLATSFLPQ